MRLEYFLSIITVLLSSFSIHATSRDYQPKHKEWKSIPEFDCKFEAEACYQNAVKTLNEVSDKLPAGNKYHNSEWTAHVLGKDAEKNKLGENHFHVSQTKKPAFVFVITHGLYGNSFQFLNLAYFLKSLNQNVISLTLPGHGFDENRAQNITYRDWKEEVRKATNLARHLGDKVILFGQSTGGVLALRQSIVFPESVQGLIMMEPAIAVRSSVEAAACMGKIFFTNAQQAAAFAKILGITLPERPINVKMGCQVGRIFKKLSTEHFKTNLPETAEADVVAEAIKMPTLTLTNINDHIVDNYTNQKLANAIEKANKGSQYEINERGMQHGIFQAYRPDTLNKVVLKFMNHHFGFQKTLQELYDNEQEKIKRVRYVIAFVEKFYWNLRFDMLWLSKASYFNSSEIKNLEKYLIDESKLATFYDCSDLLATEVCREFFIDNEGLFVLAKQLEEKYKASYGKYPELKSMPIAELAKFYSSLENKKSPDAKLMKEVTADFYALDKIKLPGLTKEALIAKHFLVGKIKNPKDLEEKNKAALVN